VRNTKVVDVIRELESFGIEVCVHDPVCSESEASEEFGLQLRSFRDLTKASATILAVAHKQFLAMTPADWMGITERNGCIIDVKAKLSAQDVKESGLHLWQL
jgi:UDP-N-acetyl-D-galactosamine dehydrogenase